MPTPSALHENLLRVFGVVKLLAGLILFVAVSWEVIQGDHAAFSSSFLFVQFVVCMIFLCDFFLRLTVADRGTHFVWRNLPFLLLSIPYLTLIHWSGVELPRGLGMFFGLIPLLRAFLALMIVVGWLVSRNVQRLLAAYIITVVVFTYISALIFYDYEALVNPDLHGFGNALWWAWMNVTTVGASIFPVTAVGKIFSVLLPVMGMMFFPIFTTYILHEYASAERRDSDV